MIRLLWWVPLGLLSPGSAMWRSGKRAAAILTWLFVQGCGAASFHWYLASPAAHVWSFLCCVCVYLVSLVTQAFVGARLPKAEGARWWSVGIFSACTIVLTGVVNGDLMERLESFTVPSGSMRPTLVEGDQFMALLDFAEFPIERGAVVVFRNPSGVAFVKRVIGFSGETVSWDGEVLRIDGAAVSSGALCLEPEYGVGARCLVEDLGDRRWHVLVSPTPQLTGEWFVPDGHVFVMGDNRDASLDSRSTGPIPVSWLVGRADVLHFSWPALSRIGRRLDVPPVEP